MIVRFIGGPKDGAEIEIPNVLLQGMNEWHVPEPICLSSVNLDERPFSFDKCYRVARYRPVHGEIGDLEFVGYK